MKEGRGRELIKDKRKPDESRTLAHSLTHLCGTEEKDARTHSSRVSKGSTRTRKDIQGYTRIYKGIQGYARIYKGSASEYASIYNGYARIYKRYARIYKGSARMSIRYKSIDVV